MSDPVTVRYRLTFGKSPAMRYTGHLDLYRALERTIRRAGLPLAYTRGYSPHPKLQLASALPLGFTGRAEMADIWLEQAVPAAEIMDRLGQSAPPGIVIVHVEPVPHAEPSLQQQMETATFEIALQAPIPGDLPHRIEALLSSESVVRERRGKAYDLRSLVNDLRLREPGRLAMTLCAREGATGRPEEVLDALGLDPLAADIERIALAFRPPPQAATAH